MRSVSDKARCGQFLINKLFLMAPVVTYDPFISWSLLPVTCNIISICSQQR